MMNKLTKAIRQYSHNDGSGLLIAYDKEETEIVVNELSLRIEKLEFALGQLINVAGQCDSWESFPSSPLDDANDILINIDK